MLGNKQLGVGAVDVQDRRSRAEKPSRGESRAPWLAPEQDYRDELVGFNHLPPISPVGKLQRWRRRRSLGASVDVPMDQRTEDLLNLAQEAGNLGVSNGSCRPARSVRRFILYRLERSTRELVKCSSE